MPVELGEWIKRLREEYLEDFIPSGGAAVRVVVAPDGDTASVVTTLERVGREEGYFVASVDANQIRAYRVDYIFYSVAREVDWEGDVDRYLRRLFHENGVKVPQNWPVRDIDRIAEANGRIRADLLNEAERLITNSILSNYALCRELRTAVAALCRAAIHPQNVAPSDADAVRLWLLGEKCPLAALKGLGIYEKIGQRNARLILTSLALWLHEVGYRGLALVADLNAVVSEHPMSGAWARYTRGTALDTYELLRQFIDGTDEVSHFLLVAVVGPGFLDHPRLSLDNYDALNSRLVDEVHERDYRNPLSAMVRLGASAAQGGERCREMS